jgi:hypothetical protein
MIEHDLFLRALKLIKAGSPAEVACAAAGVPAGKIVDYLSDPACSAAFAAAAATVEAALLARVLADESGAGARWYLERRFPSRWGATAVKSAAAARVAAAAEATPAEPDTALERAAKRRAGLRVVQ